MKTFKVCHLLTIHTVTEVKSCLLGEEASKFNSIKGVAMETRESVRRRLGWSWRRWHSGWQLSSSFSSPPNVAINFHMEEWTLAEMEKRCCS